MSSLDANFLADLSQGRSRIRTIREQRETEMKNWLRDRIDVGSFDVVSRVSAAISECGSSIGRLIDGDTLDANGLSTDDEKALNELLNVLRLYQREIEVHYNYFRSKIAELRREELIGSESKSEEEPAKEAPDNMGADIVLNRALSVYDSLFRVAGDLIRQLNLTRVSSEDLVQAVYLGLLRGGVAIQMTDTRPYLFAALRNAAISELRKEEYARREYVNYFATLMTTYGGKVPESHIEDQIAADKEDTLRRISAYLAQNMDELSEVASLMREKLDLFFPQRMANKLRKLSACTFQTFLLSFLDCHEETMTGAEKQRVYIVREKLRAIPSWRGSVAESVGISLQDVG